MSLRFDPRTGKLIDERPSMKPPIRSRTSNPNMSWSGQFFIHVVTCLVGFVAVYIINAVLHFYNLAELLLLIWGVLVVLTFIGVLKNFNNLLEILISFAISVIILYFIYLQFSPLFTPVYTDPGWSR